MRVLAPFALAAALALGALAPPAAAQEIDWEFPAGIACDFPLHVLGTGANTNFREFTDKDGNPITALFAGRGFTLTLTNLETGESLTLRSAGAAHRIVFHSDGTSTHELIGHQLLIMFPSDVPPGPSTTFYVGRVVIHVDADEVFTILQTSGRATDMCAALA